jgi:hypothetical protein
MPIVFVVLFALLEPFQLPAANQAIRFIPPLKEAEILCPSAPTILIGTKLIRLLMSHQASKLSRRRIVFK